MPDLDELEAAANRCARVEQNFCDPNDNSPISRVYDKLWNPDIPQGVSWDRDKRLIASHGDALIAQAREAKRLRDLLVEAADLHCLNEWNHDGDRLERTDLGKRIDAALTPE